MLSAEIILFKWTWCFGLFINLTLRLTLHASCLSFCRDRKIHQTFQINDFHYVWYSNCVNTEIWIFIFNLSSVVLKSMRNLAHWYLFNYNCINEVNQQYLTTLFSYTFTIVLIPIYYNNTKWSQLYGIMFCVLLANGHITLNIPVLVRSLKSSNVEPG